MSVSNARVAASLALAALVLASGPAFAQAQARAQAQAPQFMPRAEEPEEFPPGPGRDDTFYACTACHGFKLVAQQGMNRAQWEDSLQLMVDKHGMQPLPAKDRKAVLDYLEATFPPRAPSAGRGWQSPFAPR